MFFGEKRTNKERVMWFLLLLSLEIFLVLRTEKDIINVNMASCNVSTVLVIF